MSDLTPLRDDSAQDAARCRAVMPGTGFQIAYAWWSDDDDVLHLEWEPVVAFAVKRVPAREKDEVLALVRSDRSPTLQEWECLEAPNTVVLGMFTERERRAGLSPAR